LWFVGLVIIGIPWAIVWALMAGILQFVPHIGAVLGLLPPLAVAVFMAKGELLFGFLPDRVLYVLILYAVIVALDGLFLQPYFMKRTTRVPIWASIVTPLVMGVTFPFWGVVLSAPLLAVIYAYRSRRNHSSTPSSPSPDTRAS
jgi:predicted PurR-regulated permease PerM